MKKLSVLLILLVLSFSSCSLDNETSYDFNLEVMPIVNVDMPEQFTYGESYTINISYLKPNNCYEFNNFIYDINGSERTIAVVNTVYTSETANCTGEPEEVTVDFDFSVTDTETYIFKFFQGEDEDGFDHYHIIEVPVSIGRSSKEKNN